MVTRRVMSCSSAALSELSRKVKPAVESSAALTWLSVSPVNPVSVMRGYVVSFSYGMNWNSTVVGCAGSYPSQVKRMHRSGSTCLTHTLPEARYISHSQVSAAPSVILPVLLVYQNPVVIDGSARASNTSCGG